MILHRFNDDGRYIGTVNTTQEGASYEDQTRIFIGTADPRTQYHDIANNRPVDMPPKPSPAHHFDYTTKTWFDPRTLQDFKNAKWSAIKTARSAAENGGFTWDGSTFDSDSVSQGRISGAVTLAMLNPAFGIDWTLADNTIRHLNAVNMTDVGVALGQHVAVQHEKARLLRVEIESAATAAEVEAVSW